MKKILIAVTLMVFGLALGSAYANDRGNGITDFSGRSYDSLEPAVLHPATSSETVSAGRVVSENKEIYNGATDFTGRSYDMLAAGPETMTNTAEGVSAGGLRPDEKGTYNGVTDFAGRSHDLLEP